MNQVVVLQKPVPVRTRLKQAQIYRKKTRENFHKMMDEANKLIRTHSSDPSHKEKIDTTFKAGEVLFEKLQKVNAIINKFSPKINFPKKVK